MHKITVTYCCVLLLFLTLYYTGVRSGTIADCRRFKTCNVTNGTGRCDIALSWEKCNGSNATSYSTCIEEGCIENCICNCLHDAGAVTGRTFSWQDSCTGVVKGETDACGDCPTCPTPTGTPPSTDCTWNTTYCTWVCSFEACSRSPDFFGNCPYGTNPNYCGKCCYEASRDACTSQGGYFNSVDGDCRSSYDMCWDQQYECTSWGQFWNSFACGCTDQCAPSPILVDVSGDGFRLTGGAGGVSFDINGDGTPEQISWTAAGSDDAWLVLDRDGDGLIGKGGEMFGNFTHQPNAPAGGERHGFLGLAEFDRPAGDDNGGLGGNGDGVIDERDSVFASLRLWRDVSHNGVSEPGELHTLPSLDVARLHLDYKETKKADGFGNRFRYRAKVDDARGAKVNRWAWDVFLVLGQ